MINKLPGLFLFWGFGYILPLSGSISRISHPYIILLALSVGVIFLTQPALVFGEVKKKTPEDKHTFWLIMLFSLLSITAPIVEWAYFKSEVELWNKISCMGVLILLLSISLRAWAIITLGSFFTTTAYIQNNHQLITSGPYKFLRHPSYTGAYLSFIASALILNTVSGGILAAGLMLIAYYNRISVEEKLLIEKFGLKYKSYQSHTYRLFPWLW